MLLPGVFFNYIDRAYKYLLVDVSPLTPQQLRYRSEIFAPGIEIFVSNDLSEKIKNDQTNSEKFAFVYGNEASEQAAEASSY